jgi:hypothetical protein
MIYRWLAGCGFMTYLRVYSQVRQEFMQDLSRILVVREALLRHPDSFLNPGYEEAKMPVFLSL